jgi:molybdenum cofactor biosynthesis enzyme MoaA
MNTDVYKTIKLKLANEYLTNPGWKLYPRGADFIEKPAFSCNIPHRAVNIGTMGQCYLCTCDPWLPISVGHILEFDKLADIWNNPVAHVLQEDVDSKKYTWCAIEHCSVIAKDINSSHYQVTIMIDDSCNLACPSCRREIKNYTSGPIYEERNHLAQHILGLINNFDQPLIIRTSGGDALASSIMRPMLLNWTPKKDQYFSLQTNGLLLKKLLPGSQLALHMSEMLISVDAGSQAVYEQVRQPAKWQVLQENLEWVRDNRFSDMPRAHIDLSFTLQDTNAEDIINFADMVAKYKLKGRITKLDDWNTFDDFNSQDVIGNPDHPKRSIVFEQLREIKKMRHINLPKYMQDLVS